MWQSHYLTELSPALQSPDPPESNSGVIFADDLWREKIKKANCVGGCRCGLWYFVLVKKHMKEGKKTCLCPHTGPVWKVSLFQGLGFANTAEMQHSTSATREMFTKCQQMWNCTQSADKEIKAHLGNLHLCAQKHFTHTWKAKKKSHLFVILSLNCPVFHL